MYTKLTSSKRNYLTDNILMRVDITTHYLCCYFLRSHIKQVPLYVSILWAYDDKKSSAIWKTIVNRRRLYASLSFVILLQLKNDDWIPVSRWVRLSWGISHHWHVRVEDCHTGASHCPWARNICSPSPAQPLESMKWWVWKGFIMMQQDQESASLTH